MPAFRRPGTVSATVLLGLSASLVVAHAAAPDWSRRAGLDVWNMAALEHEYRAASAEREEVLAHADRSAARRAAGNQVAAKLIAHSCSLPDAADELVEIFRADDGMRAALPIIHHDAPTERHVYARHAIDRVKAILAEEPARRDAAIARLEVEYRAMCAAPESPRAP